MIRQPLRLLAPVPLLALLAAPLAAGAATDYTYPDYSGPSFDFLDMKETVQTADDETSPLFEAPTGGGDQLDFSPSSFLADSSDGDGGAGTGALDASHSTYNATIMAGDPGVFIDTILIEEAGSIILEDTGGSGTAATGGLASLSGTVEVLDALNPGDVGTLIFFGGAGSDFLSVFSPGASEGSIFVGLPPVGTTNWSASVVIDVASIVSGVTKVELQWNDFLQVSSEMDTTATVTKTSASVLVTPEPGSAALVVAGLIGIAIVSRRR